MLYRDYIKILREEWIGKKVLFLGKEYEVLDVDYNGNLLINKEAEYTMTTAVSINMVEKKGEK